LICAHAAHAELPSVPLPSRQAPFPLWSGNRALNVVSDERPGNFCLDSFLFFLKSDSNRRQRAEARAYAVSATEKQLRDDPVAHLRPRVRTYIVRVSSNIVFLDLNQNLSNFWRRDERAESKRELDSRNVPYGIFCATPKKRAK
jgi:hypothetical protein